MSKDRPDRGLCSYCKGSGYLMRTPKKSRKSLVKCLRCNGTGKPQLGDDRKEVKEIFEEIEKEFGEFAHTSKIHSGYQSEINRWNNLSDRWQALKQKALGG